MDFKVAGTREFVTALQLDTKLDGIPSDVLAGALTQARDARFAILDVMAEAIDAPDEMSPYAPRVTAVKIPVDKIGAVIGPKGQMINAIQDETGAQISIEDDGTVYVGASDGPSAQAAVDRINQIANPQMPKVGERFLGTVVKTAAFGAFVSLLPGKDGLVHISKLGNGKRISKVEDVVNVGDKLQVEITEIDGRGKISLVPVKDGDNAASTPVRRRPGARHRRRLIASSLAEEGTYRDARDRTVPAAIIRRTVLPGGLRIVTETMPWVRSASVGVWVDVGSRDESPSVAGASHFLEHLLFKGTPTRSALDIAIGMDAVGGEFNAFTEKEHTCYYATVVDRDVDYAIDVITDVVLSATIAARDVEVERHVVLEEIAMRDDDPADLVNEEFAAAVFGDTPLGRSILGSRRLDHRDDPSPGGGLLPPALPPRATWSWRSPATSTTRPSSRASGRPSRAGWTPAHESPGPARPGRVGPRAGARRPGHPRRRRRHRAGQHRAGHARAGPARPPPVRGRGAVGGARRWDVVAAVPADPRGTRPGVLGLQLPRLLRRHRDVRRLRRVPARQGRRGALAHARGARRRGP